MLPSEHRALCVSIHDVSPNTWEACHRLVEAVREVADIPLTLLIVPNYHRLGDRTSRVYESSLEQLVAKGHELALHGYTHLDEEPLRGSPWSRYQRAVFTRREGEFAGLSAGRAMLRLEQGITWFARRGWPLAGFIAPAWLLSAGTWEALTRSAFHYTTTMNRFYRLPQRDWVFSPSLVYSSRARWLYCASVLRNSFLAGLLGKGPLLRLSLHPPDARDDVIAHWQPVLYQLLATHSAMTKAEFVGLADKFAVRRICAEK
jgi:uncharacterized protein